MTIYIIYHNARAGNIPQWNYIPDESIIAKQPDQITQFDLDFVENMPNTDIVYAKIEQVPEHSNWLYVIPHVYNNAFYDRTDLKIFDHFMSIPRLWDDLIAGYGRILFDYGLEGSLSPNFVQGQLVEFFTRNRIPLDRVVFATSTANATEIFDHRGYHMQSMVLCHLELQSCGWSQGITTTPLQRSIDRRFVCFNRTYRYRLHRLQLLSKLYRRNLLDQFYYSMLDGVDDIDIVEAAAQLIGVEPSSYDTIGAMQALKPHMPMVLDTDDLTTSLAWEHTDTVESYYRRTGISIVTETFFRDVEIFFTEKIWHPVRMRHPFIVLNGPGALQHLRDLGYKTFGQWWDEGYDAIADPYDRLDAVEQLIANIASWSNTKFAQFVAESAAVCHHNLIHLQSAHTRISYDNKLKALFI
jgi:hypothetical protein